jgi:hypothetical protein
MQPMAEQHLFWAWLALSILGMVLLIWIFWKPLKQ